VLDDEINTRDLQINVERNARNEPLLMSKKKDEAESDEEEFVCVSPVP
jgi:hypothetical protein